MISKINNITSLAARANLPTKNIIKKAALPVAGLAGLSILNGASGGPAWQFNEVPPIGVEIADVKGSVDDGIIESLTYKVKHSAEILGIPEKLADLKESVADHLDVLHDHLANWGESIIESTIDTL